jgi:amino-acid N-acetyltransferase
VLVSREDDAVLGCCAFAICWENLGEIRSLVAVPEVQKQGWGRRLVEACLSEAVLFGVYRVFTLNLRAGLLRPPGLRGGQQGRIAQKVWADCLNAQVPECDEYRHAPDPVGCT